MVRNISFCLLPKILSVCISFPYFFICFLLFYLKITYAIFLIWLSVSGRKKISNITAALIGIWTRRELSELFFLWLSPVLWYFTLKLFLKQQYILHSWKYIIDVKLSLVITLVLIIIVSFTREFRGLSF